MHYLPCQKLLFQPGTPGSKKHIDSYFLLPCCPTGWQLNLVVDLDVTKESKPEKRTNKQYFFNLQKQ